MNSQVLLGALQRSLNRKNVPDRNVRRNLSRKLQKSSQWPKLFVHDVRCWSPTEHKEEIVPVAFLLPHEIIGAVLKSADLDTLMSTANMDPLTKTHLHKCQAEAGCELLGIGLWTDGIPCQWDRNESVDCVCMNFPGLGEAYSELRRPTTALPHALLSTNTMDDINAVIKESLVAAAIGVYWDKRPDNQNWQIL